MRPRDDDDDWEQAGWAKRLKPNRLAVQLEATEPEIEAPEIDLEQPRFKLRRGRRRPRPEAGETTT